MTLYQQDSQVLMIGYGSVNIYSESILAIKIYSFYKSAHIESQTLVLSHKGNCWYTFLLLV